VEARHGRGNRDHIAAGQSVYLLDSKLLKDTVWLERDVLHVRRVDASGDEYAIPDLTRRIDKAAHALERELELGVGFRVAVYPVVVIWGHFEAGEQYAGRVAYVDGDRVADWLRQRPVDLHQKDKIEAVKNWLKSLGAA
jgi:hypothetical protein